MEYHANYYGGQDEHFTNTIVVNVLSGDFSTSLAVVKNHQVTEMTTYSLALSQTVSPVPSSKHSTTGSSKRSTISELSDSYDYLMGGMSVFSSDESEEELTMTPARLSDRHRSMAVAHTQVHQHAPASDSHHGSGVSDSWELLEYIPHLDHIKGGEVAAAKSDARDHWSGEWLLKLLDNRGFHPDLVEELRTVINMVRHMNIMLYNGKKGTTDWMIKRDVMRELKEVTIQVIHCFDEFGNSLNRGIDKINEVKPLLPNLGPGADLCSLRTALKIWNARLMKELAPVRKREKQLFEGLAEFYDAMVYHAFLQVRKVNPKHDMCNLTGEFNAIYEALEFLSEAYATIDHELQKFGATYQAAKERLLSMPEVYHNEYKEQVVHDHLQARMKANAPKALDDATKALLTLTNSSKTAVSTSGIATKTPNTPFKSAMTITKEEEAQEDGEFQAIIVYLQHMKLENEAAKAKAAGEALAPVTNKSKDKGNIGSSSSTSLTMERAKKENFQSKKNSSF